jgi:PhzF family phenazine biosynthesis protein
MNSSLEFRLVDAFAMSPYSGNVAGVVLDADGLTDRQMQLIATEFNASETTFVLQPTSAEADTRFRWFSPACEVSFCGHATLGGVHALLECGRCEAVLREPGSALRIECKAGILRVAVDQETGGTRTIWLDMPDPRPKSRHVPLPPLVERLGIGLDALDSRITPIRTRDDDVILGVRSLQTLLELSPSSAELGRFCELERIRGIFVTTTNALSRATVVQSRFFAPAVGIDEDPVSGSVHGPLGHHLVECGVVPLIEGKADFLCAQGKAGGRAGIVRVCVEQRGDGVGWVRVGGSCVTTASGRLVRLPSNA